jgi:ribose transport system substrate-binding protein
MPRRARCWTTPYGIRRLSSSLEIDGQNVTLSRLVSIPDTVYGSRTSVDAGGAGCVSSAESQSAIEASAIQEAELTRIRRSHQLLFVTAAALIALAGCSSSSSSSGGGGATSSASGTSTSSGSADVSTASAALAKVSQAPTMISLTTPLKSKPPAGKVFVDLQSNEDPAIPNTTGIKEAAAALGWTVKVISFQSANPATLISAMNQALQYKPVAVSLAGLPQALWSQEVAKYQAAGAIITPIDIGPNPVSATVPINIGESTTQGDALGNWFAADSQGSGKGLLVTIPDFPALKAVSQGVTSTVAANCPNCKLTDLNATIPQQDSNAVVPAVVSALQHDPSIKYVLAAVGVEIPGLPSALKGAGINGIKIGGAFAGIEQTQDLQSGSENAWVSQNQVYEGMLAVDAAARHVEGMSISPNGGGTPIQLLTKSTVGAPSLSLNAPADALAQFKNLWHVSG